MPDRLSAKPQLCSLFSEDAVKEMEQRPGAGHCTPLQSAVWRDGRDVDTEGRGSGPSAGHGRKVGVCACIAMRCRFFCLVISPAVLSDSEN